MTDSIDKQKLGVTGRSIPPTRLWP